MLALIAGRGGLPDAVAAARGGAVIVCALEGDRPERLAVDRVFCLEQLGSLLRWLRASGVTEVCFCGAISRPQLRWSRIDLATWPLIPRVLRALRRGDDGALRIAIDLFESKGFQMLAAHEAAPELLPEEGVWGGALPEDAEALAQLGDEVSRGQAEADLGQSCVLRAGGTVAQETEAGTDAMLETLTKMHGGLLYKATKPGQDRRADLPVIGPETVRGAARAGLSGIVIEAQGVMVLLQADVRKALAETGLFLWVRKRSL